MNPSDPQPQANWTPGSPAKADSFGDPDPATQPTRHPSRRARRSSRPGTAPFAPAREQPWDRRRYRKILRTLVQEFGDAGVLRMQLEGLAHDFLEVERIRRSIEQLHRPPDLTRFPIETRNLFAENRRRSALVRSARKRLETGETPLCAPNSVEQLCRLLQESARELAPSRPRLADGEYLSAVIRGTELVEEDDRPRIREFLVGIERGCEARLRLDRGAWEMVQSQRNTAMVERSPQAVKPLADLLEKFEQRIERTLRDLREE